MTARLAPAEPAPTPIAAAPEVGAEAARRPRPGPKPRRILDPLGDPAACRHSPANVLQLFGEIRRPAGAAPRVEILGALCLACGAPVPRPGPATGAGGEGRAGAPLPWGRLLCLLWARYVGKPAIGERLVALPRHALAHRALAGLPEALAPEALAPETPPNGVRPQPPLPRPLLRIERLTWAGPGRGAPPPAALDLLELHFATRPAAAGKDLR